MNNLDIEYVYTDKNEIVVKTYNNYFDSLFCSQIIMYKFKYDYSLDDLFIVHEKICSNNFKDKHNVFENYIKQKYNFELKTKRSLIKTQVMFDLDEAGIIDEFRKEIDNEVYKQINKNPKKFKIIILHENEELEVTFDYHGGWKNNSSKWSFDKDETNVTFFDEEMLSQILCITTMLNQYGKEYFEKTK